jgi:hypothetical protein
MALRCDMTLAEDLLTLLTSFDDDMWPWEALFTF